MAKDFYNILGVSKDASAEEIKKSFRRLAHEHHPDKGGDAQKFKDINEAYQVLGDVEKRKQYDHFGSAAFEQGGMGGPQGGFGGFGFDPSGFSVNMEDMGDLGEMFGSMFGFGGGRSKGKRGSDVEVDVTIAFRDAVFGIKRDVSLYVHAKCSGCEGTGAEKGTAVKQCTTCSGTGAVRRIQRTVFGSVQTAATCETCSGTGSVPEKPCTTCKGVGVERRTKTITVDIPAGISDGEALKFTGEGEYPGANGRAGDLYVRIRVSSDKTFTREGNDIFSTAEVPFSTLALGGSISVETIEGNESLSVPSGTRPGTVFRLRGKGVPFLRSRGRGDHHVTVTPVVPKHLSREQKKLLEDLKREGL